MKRILLTAVILSLFTGCVQMQVNPAADDADAKAKSLAAPKGKALVYIIRPTMLGKPFAHEITMDGKKIGSTCGYYYIYAFASPGKHKFTAKGDNTGELDLSTDSGKTYYVQQKVYPLVWKGGVSLAVVNEAEGKKFLSECRLSGDTLAGQ